MSMTKTRVAVAGAAALALVGGATAATAASTGSSKTTASAAAACERVTGLTFLLDALQSGGAAGPGVVYGVVSTAVGAAFPPGPLAEAQSQVLAAGAQGVEQIAIAGPDAVKQLKAATAMLAAYNEQINQIAEYGPDGLNALADAGGETIAPFDLTLRQMAGIAAQTIEPTSC